MAAEGNSARHALKVKFWALASTFARRNTTAKNMRRTAVGDMALSTMRWKPHATPASPLWSSIT